jgi:tRNA(Ile)-lysidine synthase
MKPRQPAPELSDADKAAIDRTPLTPEETLALFRAALGSDACHGMLLAVSGGPDSIAMLGLAAAAAAFLPPFAVATVDHGLREESRHEAAFVADFCRELGLKHCTLVWKDGPCGRVSQETAREGRYALLAAHTRSIDASHIVTAHTLDDQAETVLMRMAAGSGVAGLGAMRPNVARGAFRHIRPLLEIPKARLIATCTKMNWHYSRDPSNTDPRYTRSRFRALMPILAGEGLTTERLGTLAARARRTEDALDLVAKRNVEGAVLMRAPDGGAIRLKADGFHAEPFDLALRMLRRAMLAIDPLEDSQTRDTQTQISLAKLERLLKNLRIAIQDQRPFRQTLAHAVIAHSNGCIEVRTAPPRRNRQV